MEKFNYITEKISKCKFNSYPFKHLYIEDFLSDFHLNLIKNDPQIILPPQKDTRDLIQTLKDAGYVSIRFPGCVTDLEKYIRSYESNSFFINEKRVEAFGVAFKLKKILCQEIKELIDFLNGSVFHECLERKFSITRKNNVSDDANRFN